MLNPGLRQSVRTPNRQDLSHIWMVNQERVANSGTGYKPRALRLFEEIANLMNYQRMHQTYVYLLENKLITQHIYAEGLRESKPL